MASSTQSTVPTDAQSSAAVNLFNDLMYTSGSAVFSLCSGEFSDTELYVDDRDGGEFQFFEDDGTLHAREGHFRLACHVGQDGTSELRSVQNRFQRAARQFFAQHGAQFHALLS